MPATDWIEQGVEFMRENPDCGLAGGAIELFYRDPERMTGVELYESLMGFPQQRYIEKERFGATANVFTRREVIERVGRFNDALKSGGDSEWGKRVAAAGFPLRYAGQVRVAHPARSTYTEYYRKTVRVMSGLPAFRDQRLSLATIGWRLVKGVLVPPVARVRKVLALAGDKSAGDRFKLTMVVLFIRWVWVLEGARLQTRNRRP